VFCWCRLRYRTVEISVFFLQTGSLDSGGRPLKSSVGALRLPASSLVHEVEKDLVKHSTRIVN